MALTEALGRYWQEQMGLARAAAEGPEPFNALRAISGLAIVISLSAAVLWLVGGYHAGFFTLNGFTPVLPAWFWSLLTCLGDSAVALALFLLLAQGNWHLCRVILIASIIGLAWTHGFKQFAPMPRPEGLLALEQFNSIGDLSSSGSFPSGHAQAAMTLAAVAALCAKRALWIWSALILGLASALSRVFVGMHWPVDVLAGAAGGLVCVLLATAIAARLGPPRAWPVMLTLALCVIAAAMVSFGHPDDYPAAQPWLSLLGIATLLSFLWPVGRALVRDRT